MISLAYMVVDITFLGGTAFSMDFACSDMESIIISGISLYITECTVDLVLCLIVRIFCCNIDLCLPAACVCSVYGTRSAYIFLK